MHNQPLELNAANEIFARAIERVRARQLSVLDTFAAAGQLQALAQRQLVIELYKSWIAYNGDDPLLYAVYFNYGVALAEVRDFAGAINAYREGIRVKPDFYPPYINLGRALEDSGQAGVAVTQWLSLVNSLPSVTGDAVSHKITALQQIGRVLEGANSDAAAEDALKQSLNINVHQPEAIQHYISLRQRQCKWPVIADWDRVSRKELLKGISPLSLANLADDPMFQLARAYDYAKHQIGRPKPARLSHAQAASGRQEPRKLRIGYVSSDLRNHAVGFAMTDVMEQHDRENFEIFA